MTKAASRSKGLFGIYGSRGLRDYYYPAGGTWQKADMVATTSESYLHPQKGSREQATWEWQVFEFPEPFPGDILLLPRTLLPFTKQCHPLGTKYSNARDYGVSHSYLLGCVTLLLWWKRHHSREDGALQCHLPHCSQEGQKGCWHHWGNNPTSSHWVLSAI